MKELFTLLRPTHWSKNLFVFLPLFFGQEFNNLSLLGASCVAFLLMSMLSSCIYILNDICDLEYDRWHREKSHRPIAAGRVSIPVAYLLCGVLLSLVALLVWLLMPRLDVVIVLGIYFLMNVAYVFKIKNIAIIDLLVVAFGFVLRILLGAVVIEVQPSHWIVLMTLLLALFLVMAKRRDDVLMYEQENVAMRRNIKAYNRLFLDHAITLVAAVMLVSYIMYTVDDENIARFDCNYIYTTTIFVIAALLRYLQIIFIDQKSGSPTRIIMKDTFLQCCVAGWLLLFAYIIYG